MNTTPAQPNDTQGSFLTRQEVARRLSVHPATVQRMQRTGRLTAYVLGVNLVRYSEAEVSSLISASKVALGHA